MERNRLWLRGHFELRESTPAKRIRREGHVTVNQRKVATRNLATESPAFLGQDAAVLREKDQNRVGVGGRGDNAGSADVSTAATVTSTLKLL